LAAIIVAAFSAGGLVLSVPLTTGSAAFKILFIGSVNPATGLLEGSCARNATFPDGSQETLIMDTDSAGMGEEANSSPQVPHRRTGC
jgi:hypothetical protein